MLNNRLSQELEKSLPQFLNPCHVAETHAPGGTQISFPLSLQQHEARFHFQLKTEDVSPEATRDAKGGLKTDGAGRSAIDVLLSLGERLEPLSRHDFSGSAPSAPSPESNNAARTFKSAGRRAVTNTGGWKCETREGAAAEVQIVNSAAYTEDLLELLEEGLKADDWGGGRARGGGGGGAFGGDSTCAMTPAMTSADQTMHASTSRAASASGEVSMGTAKGEQDTRALICKKNKRKNQVKNTAKDQDHKRTRQELDMRDAAGGDAASRSIFWKIICSA
jgi:hypothetical protein